MPSGKNRPPAYSGSGDSAQDGEHIGSGERVGLGDDIVSESSKLAEAGGKGGGVDGSIGRGANESNETEGEAHIGGCWWVEVKDLWSGERSEKEK